MLTLLTVVLTFMLTLRCSKSSMFMRVVNLLTFKGLLSRVRRGKGKRRDQPRPQTRSHTKPSEPIGTYTELSEAIREMKFFRPFPNQKHSWQPDQSLKSCGLVPLADQTKS